MKVLFVTDLHGSKWKYDRLLEAAKDAEVDVVINGGDMLPKSGSLFKQGDFIGDCLDQHFSQFNSQEIYYLCYLGNDDLMIFDSVFNKACAKYDFVTNIAQRKFKIGEYEFIGMNWVVDYPFRLKDRCRMDTKDYEFQEQRGDALLSTRLGWQTIEYWIPYAKTQPTIEDELSKLPTPENASKSVYVIHMPPCGLGLDKCHDGSEVGSVAVFDFLNERQPPLALHGHIHESPEVSHCWHKKLGETLCIQPGQLDEFTYVIIDLATMKFNRVKETV